MAEAANLCRSVSAAGLRVGADLHATTQVTSFASIQPIPKSTMAILQLDTHVVDLCQWEDARKVEVLLTWVVHGAVGKVRNILAVAAALAPLDACSQSKGTRDQCP